ncbi:MAG: FtsX-like permease family protein, partial [Pseudomonadota bacterium]
MGLAQGLLGLEGRLSRLMAAAPRPGASPAPLAEAAPGLRRERAAPEADLGQLTESFHLNLTAFGLLSFAVGLFIVHGAIGLAFEQRKPLMRTLRAVGLSAQDLTLALLAELLALALLAGAAGVALGYVIAGALLPDVALSLRGLYGAQVPGALSLSPWWWAAGLAMSLLGAGAASAAALARAARLPVLASAQPEAWLAEERRRLRLQGGAAASLGAAALGLTLFGQGLVAGFALMGALLIGAALALPPVLAAGLAWASGRRSAARRPLLHWALADARQGLPGLSLALMALLMALAVNIGVGAMVDGFRLTFTVWLEDRLAADAYVRAQAGREAELEDWMQARAEVLAILPEISAETALGGWPVELRGFSADPLYAARWPLLEAASEVWDRVGYGEAALVSEQLARREGLALGDVVELSA